MKSILAVIAALCVAGQVHAGGFVSPNGVLIVNNNNNAMAVQQMRTASIQVEQRGGLFGRRVQRANVNVNSGGSVNLERRGPFGGLRASTRVNVN